MLNDIASAKRSNAAKTGRSANRWRPPAGATRCSRLRSPPCRTSSGATAGGGGVPPDPWFLSEAAGKDVGVDEAVRSYVERELPNHPAERIVLEP
jgi:hypothetical protein